MPVKKSSKFILLSVTRGENAPIQQIILQQTAWTGEYEEKFPLVQKH
jgi:hypothetical protein